MLALLFPVLAYGIYLFCFNYFSTSKIFIDYYSSFDILLSLYVGIVLGFYIVLLRQNTDRRKIAFIHCLLSLILLALDFPATWIFMVSGVSIAMTRHNQIQPLCPLPKTRMIIMSCLPLISLLFVKINLSAIFIEVINGLLMGFYVWMKERLNDDNREIVTNLTFFIGLGLSFMFRKYIYIFIPWIIFVKIIQIFNVKFIQCSQK